MNTWGRPTVVLRPSGRIGSIWSNWCQTARAGGWSVRQASRSAKNKNSGMTHMTTNFHHLPGSARHRARRWVLGATLAFSGVFAGSASAANALQNVSYDAQPGGRIELTLAFSGAAPDPKVFTTNNPPRIAID